MDAEGAAPEVPGADVSTGRFSAALAMRRPAALVLEKAAESGRPVSWGMTKACGLAEAGWLTRMLTRGRSTPEAFGGGVWARTVPEAPGAAILATVPSSSEERRRVREAGRSD